MPRTYDPGLLTDCDWVRLLIGDTDVPDNAVLADEEINAFVAEIITEHGSGTWVRYLAAHTAGLALAAATLSTTSDVIRKTVGRLSITRESGVDSRGAYAAHIAQLEAKGIALLNPRPRGFGSVGSVRS